MCTSTQVYTYKHMHNYTYACTPTCGCAPAHTYAFVYTYMHTYTSPTHRTFMSEARADAGRVNACDVRPDLERSDDFDRGVRVRPCRPRQGSGLFALPHRSCAPYFDARRRAPYRAPCARFLAARTIRDMTGDRSLRKCWVAKLGPVMAYGDALCRPKRQTRMTHRF